MDAGGDINEVWELYGCNNYDVVFLAIASLDSKNEIVSAYKSFGLDTIKFPIIASEGGSRSIAEKYDAVGSGGPTYLIRPNKTLTSSGYSKSSLIWAYNNAGIEEHECDQTGNFSPGQTFTENIMQIGPIHDRKISINIPTDDSYQLTIYSLNGKVVKNIHRRLAAGRIIISLKSSEFKSGMYIVSLKNSTNRIVKKRFMLE